MNTLVTIIQDLISVLSNETIDADLSQVANLATQILALVGNKNAERQIQSADAYKAAQAGSVTAGQWLYHNSQPDSGMPHEDIIDGQFYWAKLLSAGWTAVNGTVVPPAPSPR